MSAYDVVWTARFVTSVGVTLGMAACRTPSGYIPADTAARVAYTVAGIVCTLPDTQGVCSLQYSGEMNASVSGLGPGTKSAVRVGPTGLLERASPPDYVTDVVVGDCDVLGNVTITWGASQVSPRPSDSSVVDTIALLRLAPITSTIETLGYWGPGDGGGGEFYWDAACVLADDGGLTILPTGHVGAGRRRRLVQGAEFPVEWFGAKGDWGDTAHPGTVDAAALTAAIAAAAASVAYGFGGGTVVFDSKAYNIGSASFALPAQVCLRGKDRRQSTLVFYGQGHAFTVAPYAVGVTALANCSIENLNFYCDLRVPFVVGGHITAISTGSTTAITTSANHGLSNGDEVFIAGNLGATILSAEGVTGGINGWFFAVTVTGLTTFTIAHTTGGTYTGGGAVWFANRDSSIYAGSKGAALYCLGSASLHIYDCNFGGWRDCIVGDGLETSVIRGCYFSGWRSGIFLPAGSEYTAGQSPGLTNYVDILHCDFDGTTGCYGVVANGGASINLAQSSFQWHQVAHASFGACTPFTWDSSYCEGSQRGIIITGDAVPGQNPAGVSGVAGCQGAIRGSIFGGQFLKYSISCSPWGGSSSGGNLGVSGNYFADHIANVENESTVYIDWGKNVSASSPPVVVDGSNHAVTPAASAVAHGPLSIGIGTLLPGNDASKAFYGLDMWGQLKLRQQTYTLTTATTNALDAWSVATAARFDTNTAADFTLAGLANGSDGWTIEGINVSAYYMTLAHMASGPGSTDKIYSSSLRDIVIPPGGAFKLRYDATSTAWRVLSTYDAPSFIAPATASLKVTNDASAKVVASYPLPDNATTTVLVEVVMKQSAGTSSPDGAAFTLKGVWMRDAAGAPSVIKAAAVTDSNPNANGTAWTAVLSLNGNAVEVHTTTDAAKTVTIRCSRLGIEGVQL